MQIYRKGLRVQMLLFGVFAFMGLHVILTHLYEKDFPWLMYAGLVVLVLTFVIGLLMYRSKDQSVAIITAPEVKKIKYLMYGYFIVYLFRLVLTNRVDMNQDLIQIVAGVLLIGIAIFGIIVQYRIYQHK
jgi:hypothetical protein